MNWAETHKTRVLLAAATLIPIGVLAWMGMWILAQERNVENQHARENLEVAAGRLAIGIERQLTDIVNPASGGKGLRFTTAGLVADHDTPLLYQPETSSAFGGSDPSSGIFAEAETQEYRHQNFEVAASAYREFAKSQDLGIRAGALLRLARVLRRRGDSAGALQSYDKLSELGLLSVDGFPSSLVARQGRAAIFAETGATGNLHREAHEFADVLYAGGLPIDRAVFGVYSELLQQWGEPGPSAEAVARTEAGIEVWQQWHAGELPRQGRQIIHEKGTPVLAVWEQKSVWLATPDRLESFIAPLAEAQHLNVRLTDIDGQPFFGPPISGGASLTPGETRLPFILTAAERGTTPGKARAVLISGLTLAFLLMIAAAYGLYRVTTRELMLARQQSDFVSAVSHELRTPLTSMRHLTELLLRGAAPGEERREQYYFLLANETERLNRIVEGLLSFGRIEAGAYAWHLEPADVSEIARGIVDDFRQDPAAAGHPIVSETADSLPLARVDREAFSRAMWNLLENAAKYSESGKAIRVFVRKHQDSLLVGVEDEGAGIPPSERETIFRKFVRGADAKREGIRGVGIGLALVQRIIEAHGGSVRVESELGRGSTFTLVIPCQKF